MATTAFPTRDEFAALLNESLGGEDESFEGKVVKGTVTAIENDMAVIDVGLKSEGRVPLREFAAPGQRAELTIGDEVEVYVDRVENAQGEAMLSRDRARREAAWDKLEKEHEEGNRVEGVIFGRVKGGFTVDLGGAVAFLPGSQVDIRPVRDVGPLMDSPQPFQILKMDRRRGNIVVSRRAILEETRAEQRSGLIQSLTEGQVLDGVVKNITDYGAFVDLGGIDGLLHVTDISYKRVNHPSEVLGIGDTVKVQIIRINRETQRISLGMKQLEADPWEGAAAKYPVDGTFTGRVTNITEYGAFVELDREIGYRRRLELLGDPLLYLLRGLPDLEQPFVGVVGDRIGVNAGSDERLGGEDVLDGMAHHRPCADLRSTIISSRPSGDHGPQPETTKACCCWPGSDTYRTNSRHEHIQRLPHWRRVRPPSRDR